MTGKIILITILLNLGFMTVFAQKRGQPKDQREVTIYLLRELEGNEPYDPDNPLWLFPVKRRIDARTPLAGALRVLVKGATKEEQRRKYFSSTFGIRFISVTLENGQALARFTMPKTASFSGDNSESIFKEAVRKTAEQFKEVKEIVVCLDGEANFEEVEGLPRKKC